MTDDEIGEALDEIEAIIEKHGRAEPENRTRIAVEAHQKLRTVWKDLSDRPDTDPVKARCQTIVVRVLRDVFGFDPDKTSGTFT